MAGIDTFQQFIAGHSGLLLSSAVATVVSVKALSWLSTYSRDKALEFPISLDDQSVEIEVSHITTGLSFTSA